MKQSRKHMQTGGTGVRRTGLSVKWHGGLLATLLVSATTLTCDIPDVGELHLSECLDACNDRLVECYIEVDNCDVACAQPDVVPSCPLACDSIERQCMPQVVRCIRNCIDEAEETLSGKGD